MADQFNLTEKNNVLDIVNDDWFQGQFDRSQYEMANRFETQFIDEVYGTDNAMHPADGLPQAVEGIGVTYGLDLRRSTPAADLEIGSQNHFEWLTRGDVDWASYRSDPMFIKTFKEMQEKGIARSKSYYGADWSGLMDPNEQDDDQRWSDKARVDMIRDAQNIINNSGAEKDPEAWWTEWDNKYVPPEAEDIKPPQYLTVKDFTSTITKDVAEPTDSSVRGSATRAAVTADIQIRKVQPKRPPNISKSWGPIK